MGRDDDRVGGEAPKRVLERLERISVTDLAADPQAGTLKLLEGRLRSRSSGFASAASTAKYKTI